MELAEWQTGALRAIRASALGKELTFGGGAARVDARVSWEGLRVESLLDMTVNKIQAVLTRFQPRDFVDLYFLLHEGPERDLDRLLELVRSKFDNAADRFALANRFLAARSIEDLPSMVRPLDLETLRLFFFELARDLVRRG